MPYSPIRLLSATLFLLLLPSCFALVQPDREDRASIGHDVIVTEGETAGDIACALCSVTIHGDVRGDVAVLFGNITIDSGHSVSGDVALMGGDLTMSEDSNIGGDVAIAGGNLNAADGSSIRGSRAVFAGRFWLLLPLAPLLLIAGIIWLIIYMVRRNRYRVPAYPHANPRM